MKKILLIISALVSFENQTHAFSFSDAFNAAKNAVEGGVSKASGGSATNQQAQAQLDQMIDKYQSAIQDQQVAIQYEAGIVAAQQNTIMRCEVEKGLYLHLLPHAPPVSDPDLYKLMVLITLMSLFDPATSADQRRALQAAISPDQYIRLGQTLVILTNDDIQKLRTQWIAATPPKAPITPPTVNLSNLPGVSAICDATQLANGFLSGIYNLNPGSSNYGYVFTSAMSVNGFKTWCWNSNTSWWHGSTGCSQDLCGQIFSSIQPQIQERFCDTTRLGDAFLASWQALKPGDPDEAYLRQSAANANGFKAWAWNLDTDWWHGNTPCHHGPVGCSQDLANDLFYIIKPQIDQIDQNRKQ